MKKTLKRVLVMLSLICAIGIGTTFAFLTFQTNSITNTFTSNRNIRIELKEPTWDGYALGDSIPSDVIPGSAVKPGQEGNANLGLNQAKNYLPKDVINKDPMIKNTSTSDSAYVAFKVVFTDENSNKITRTEFEQKFGKLNIQTGFTETVNADKSSLFIFDTTLAVNATTTLFNQVAINENVAITQNGGLPSFAIQVTGYAIQGNVDITTATTELKNLAK